METSNYWIGKDTDYASVWDAYDNGLDYIDVFRSKRLHLLRIELQQFPVDMAIFNFEAVYKTVKGYYHDMKLYGLSDYKYGITGPLFIYSVDRGSSTWNFLGELVPVLALALTLVREGINTQEIENLRRNLQNIQEFFPEVDSGDIEELVRANLPTGTRRALRRLSEQGIQNVGVSQGPFDGDIEGPERSLISIDKLIVNLSFGDSVGGDKIGNDKISSGDIHAGRGSQVTVGKMNTTQSWREANRVRRLGQTELEILAEELSYIRRLKNTVPIDPELNHDTGQIAAAELAAKMGSKRSAELHLKNAGSWLRDFAIEVGASLTAEYIKKVTGM